MKIPDKLYNILKWVCLIALPAVNVFLFAVLPVLGVEKQTVTAIVTIISAVGTLIGSLIGISTVNYYKNQ